MDSRTTSSRSQQRRSRIPTRSSKELSSSAEGLKMRTNLEGRKKPVWNSGKPLSKTVGPKELKENVLPVSARKKPQEQKLARKPPKSYMEVTRENKELREELQNLREIGHERNTQHDLTVAQLSHEIQQLKEVQSKLRQEIGACREVVAARNDELAAMRINTEKMKFENDRITFILEGARVDVATGKDIHTSQQLASHRQLMDMEFEGHNKDLDFFMNSLEDTITSQALAPPRCQDCRSTGPSFSPHFTAQHSTS